MKKYLAVLLAVILICSFSMLGCVKTDVEETTAQTEETPVLLTAEEYFMKSLEVGLSSGLDKSKSYNSARMSLGVADVEYLLSLFAMQDMGLPEISDVIFDIQADAKDMRAAYMLSAIINGHYAEVAMHLDMSDLGYVISSNLFEDVLLFDFSEDTDMDIPDFANIYPVAYELVENYTLICGELLMEHNSGIELIDNGDTVTVLVSVDAEKSFDYIKALVDKAASDEKLVDFLREYYYTDFNEDVKIPFDENAEEFKTELIENGAKLSIGLDIDKEIFMAYSAEIEVSTSEESVAISIEQMDGAASLAVSVGEEMNISVGYLTAPDTYSLDFNFEAEDLSSGGHFLAEDGIVDFAMYVNTSEYDWDAGKYVEVLHEISAGGTYTADESSFAFNLGKIAYNDIEIDLAKAGITLVYELNGEVSKAPEATKSVFDISDAEGEALIRSIFEKLEVDPALFGLGASEPETEMEYTEIYEEI